jgi:NADH:ubiquinone oxidoreductase subunit 3 (subunit A)
MFETEAVDEMKTRIFFNFFQPKVVALYQVMWNSMVDADRPQVTYDNVTEKMRFECRISKAGTRTRCYDVEYLLLAYLFI